MLRVCTVHTPNWRASFNEQKTQKKFFLCKKKRVYGPQSTYGPQRVFSFFIKMSFRLIDTDCKQSYDAWLSYLHDGNVQVPLDYWSTC